MDYLLDSDPDGEQAHTQVSHLSNSNCSLAAWMVDVMATCATESFHIVNLLQLC